VGKTTGVPRGLLRLLVLKMLSEKPMSGAEISEQIEMQTNGHWKPSSGSIYPLLAWMHDKGFTKESPKANDGLKRYTFTTQGSKFFEKQIDLGKDFLDKMEFLLPMLIGGLQFEPNKEKLRIVVEPARKLMSTFMSIRHNLDSLSQKETGDIAQALADCSEKLEGFTQKTRANET
jgi:DNA-binding PadR family transcriptional regulator